jgi:hypothetical protein
MTYPNVALRASVCLCLLVAACQTEAPLATPVLPPPPPDPCAPFHLQYTSAGDGGPYDCPDVDCHCGTYSGPVPSPIHGCLQSIDCTVACHSNEDWLSCVVFACASSADCVGRGYVCVVAPGATEGLCQDPTTPDSFCFRAEDCAGSLRCVAVEADGTRRCVDPAIENRFNCNGNADCPVGHCALSRTSFLGMCTTGEKDERCFSDADCAPHLACKDPDVPGFCSE